MSAERMRQEFEAWWSATMNTQEMDLHRFVGGGYACHETNRAWMAWQASRAALVVELPDPIEVHDTGDYQADTIDVLQSAGITVKP